MRLAVGVGDLDALLPAEEIAEGLLRCRESTFGKRVRGLVGRHGDGSGGGLWGRDWPGLVWSAVKGRWGRKPGGDVKEHWYQRVRFPSFIQIRASAHARGGRGSFNDLRF